MEDYTGQNLKKIPKVLSGSIDCRNNKLRYIPNNLRLNDLYFTSNRIKRLPNLLMIKSITSGDNKIKDRSRLITLHCFGNKYNNYLCRKLD
jgi:hypothetical protein